MQTSIRFLNKKNYWIFSININGFIDKQLKKSQKSLELLSSF